MGGNEAESLGLRKGFQLISISVIKFIKCKLFFDRGVVYSRIMKRVILFSGAFALMLATLQSCTTNYKMPRPQRHPTPPKKFVQHQEVQDQHVAVVYQQS